MSGLIGIFERNDGTYYWLDCMTEDEIKGAKYFVDESNYASIHCCVKTILDGDIDGYVDTLQNEESSLVDGELYVVTYHHAFMDCWYWNLEGLVDFGLTKDEIIENVKNQKYVEGADYFTMGQMFYETRQMMEELRG